MGFQGLTGYGGGATSLFVRGATGSGMDASGGTTTTPGDGYKYHWFTSPGTFTVSQVHPCAASLHDAKGRGPCLLALPVLLCM